MKEVFTSELKLYFGVRRSKVTGEWGHIYWFFCGTKNKNKFWCKISNTIEVVLVNLGFHNKTPQAVWCKQKTFIFSQFKILESPRSMCQHDSISGEGSLLGLQMASLYLYSLSSEFRMGARWGWQVKEREKEGKWDHMLSSVCSYKDLPEH